MSLRFIYGRAGSGKSHFCYSDIKSSINENKPMYLLVPEDFSFQAEKELLKVVGETGILKARVLSFKRIAYAVFNEVGGLTRRHMNSAGRCMLLYRIMDEVKGELKVFSKAAKMQGFVNTLSDMITELKIYNVTPEILNEAAERVEENGVLKDKLHDIDLIYSKFESALHKNYIDSDDDLTILVRKLDISHMFDGAEIWVDGFSMFTPQQYSVLQKLLKKAERVNVTLCMDCCSGPSGDVFSSIKSIEERVVKIAAECNIPIEEPVFLRENYKFKDNKELCHIEENLFTYPNKTYGGGTKYMSLFRALNKYSEVENTARDIVRLCRDEGLRYSDIAVVTRDVEGYEKLAEAIFSEYEIPYFLDKKREISDSPLIMLVLSALEILSRNWTYEAVFRYLKTGLTGVSWDDIDLLENYVLACGIKGKKWTEEKDWNYWPNYGYNAVLPDEAKDALNRINEIRKRVISPLMELDNKICESKKVRDISENVFNFLCAVGVPTRIDELIGRYKSSGELDLANEYSGIWNMLIEALDQAVEVLGDEEMSIDGFVKVLSIGFGEYSIGLIPPSLDQVTFGSVERIKSRSIKALYILGVNDGVFPSPAGDEGILSDSDREKLKGIGLELAPDTRDRMRDEQFLVYTVFTRAERYLRISYPIADHEGRAMRPSIIISRFKRIFQSINEESDIISHEDDDESLKLISRPIPTFNELICAMRRNADGELINPVWKSVYGWYMGRDDWREKCLRAMGGIAYKNEVRGIDEERVRELYGKRLSFSISRLEKFAECPFSYFLQYGLKAKERKVYELTPPDLGSFIHTILDEFSKYLDDNNLTWRDVEKNWCEKVISDIVDGTVEKSSGSILSSSARYKYLKDRLKRIIWRAVNLIALHIKRGGFDPVYHEVSFENGGKYPPITINLPSGEKIKLIGRIDRVDALETDEAVYVRVVDYKSGRKEFNLSDIYNGLELQLLIYLDAILEYYSKNSEKPVYPGGILYFRIDDPMVKSNGEMSDEDIEKEIMKELKMKGLILSDVKVVREMDRDIQSYSIIIPAMIKADGTLGSNSSAASSEDFDNLRKHVKKMIVNLCEDMLKGNISISPYRKKGEVPCTYCTYKPVCRFDVSINENGYRFVRDKSKDEVWEAIKEVNTYAGMDQ